MNITTTELVNLILKYLDGEIEGLKGKIFDSPFLSVETAFKFGAVQALKSVKTECEKLIKELNTIEQSEIKEESINQTHSVPANNKKSKK